MYDVVEWDDITFGGQAQMLANYERWGKGTFIFGTQFEHLSLSKGTLLYGGDYNMDGLPSSIINAFESGNESTISLYTQLKHTFFSRLILNAGLRFDYKIHYYYNTLEEYGIYKDNKLSQLSPRVSLLYKFDRAVTCRASYNFSMVDAPYAYRACHVPYFSGGYDLSAETMKSFQLDFSYHKPDSPIGAEICGFYNIIDDMIDVNLNHFEYQVFKNSGNIRQVAIDASLQYKQKDFFINANATWQKVCSSSGTSVCNGNKYGIPWLYGNAVLAWNPYSFKGNGFFNSGRLWLRCNATIQSNTYYRTFDLLNATFANAIAEYDPSAADIEYAVEKDVSAQILLGVGATYDCKHISLDVTVKNITNNQYMVGSCLA